jgi:hypothetical protein
MNWRRPANVARIVAGWKSGGIVTEAIVWNNNPDPKFAVPLGLPAKVISTRQDLGLYPRQPAHLGDGQRRLRATRRSLGRPCDHAGAPLGS